MKILVANDAIQVFVHGRPEQLTDVILCRILSQAIVEGQTEAVVHAMKSATKQIGY